MYEKSSQKDVLAKVTKNHNIHTLINMEVIIMAKRKKSKIQNYIIIEGKPVKVEDIPPEQMKEIATTLAIRFAKALGYEPVEDTKNIG